MTVRRYGRYYWCDFMVEGKRYRKSLKVNDKSLAQKIETKFRDEIISDRWFHKEPAQDKTFKDLIDKFHSGQYISEKSFAAYESVLKSLEIFFGETPLKNFSPKLVEDFKLWMINKGHKPNTIIHKLKILKRLFNLAVNNWQWFEKNPISNFKIGSTINRERRLTGEEEEKLFSSSPLWLREFISFTLNTGFRRGETLSLSWKDVDLHNRVIHLKNTKNQVPLSIPMNDVVFNLLKEKSKVRNLNNDRIFPFSIGVLEPHFRKVCSEAGISNLHIHDLRHSFASKLIEKGVDVSIVQKLLNHKNLTMTQRYLHHNYETLRSAVSKLS